MNLRLLPVACALAVLAAAPSASASHQDDHPPRGITTQGNAVVATPHDLAAFTFSASVRRSTPSAAQRVASRRLARVISAVRRAGVAADDVQTGSIRLSRLTRRTPSRRIRVIGYRASQSINVTVRDLPRAGAIVDIAVRAGATGVSGPRFDISNRAAVYREALRLALRDAREKAQALAQEAGVTLGRVTHVVEGGDAEPSNFLNASAPESAAGGSTGRVPTPVRPGNEEIGALVLVTFETA
jgi:hypothetical protein